ncbi:uncharacterized protein LOC104885327 isoform X1 [Beta vulgaris subsp. vulgaris]|uniref:uncharacterized protein LOC104885327 isoform X1 n=1 Tax=Beta vulgaris subsp. vulgaris TaxID=3555 RepID=UPI0020369E6A|nr:uncharacterized protein LOC104885327 isoform X1 [Beta vulgaris subsp. vulgaris]
MLSAGVTASPLHSTPLLNHKLSPSFINLFQKINEKPNFTGKFIQPTNNILSKSIKFHVKSSSSTQGFGSSDQILPPEEQQQDQTNVGFWQKWKANSAEMSAKLAKLGLAAVLAYGLFDGVTYTTFFVMSFLGYEKSTGNNPAANLNALIGIVLLMWAGNNVTRPFRVAGAAALAPVIDKGLRKIQKALNLPSLVYAFSLVVGIVATSCFTVIGLLILSRWGK